MDQAKLEVDDVFCAAVEMALPAERAAYLDQVCGDDLETRRRVERLLEAQSQAGSFLVARPSVAAATTDFPTERPGTIIGPYKLLQQIGEGGMGTVFMAEQTRPVQRKVALKVIKAGMDTRQVIARFEAERQALAMMDHVNIARVLDAGATESGRPYFVMELVHGVPITKYCDDNHLTPRERLELFVPVCQAIQHAHQKGIIHRDIKPSNVMITLYDGKPVPKVIDFGVAKATEQKLTERTLFTQYGTMVGTLEYMSPEQAEMSALGADTRSDIFSLGVLLYELLTGSTPLTHKRVREAAYAEVLRLIKEEEPPRPSTRLSDSGAALASISAQRHMEPAKLTKLIRGELDWIVMKCLEKDRNRRYETANGFAADVRRYLDDEPVQACPPSVTYNLRKFVRRNRRALTMTSVLALAMLVVVGSLGWMVRDRAATAEQVARENAGRLALLEGRISQALDEAQAAYESDKLPEAISTVKRADALLASDSGVSNEIRQRADQWRAELTILQRLEELGFLPLGSQFGKMDAAYSQVFFDIGINIDGMPVEEAGRRIRSCLTWKRLTEALDDWAGIRHEIDALANFTADGGRRRQRLFQVARAADSDELRSQARLAAEKWDLKAAQHLADSPEVSRLPSSTLGELSMVIYYGGGESRREAAVRLLMNAQIQRPGDFRLNAECANFFRRMEPPRWAEAAHYWSIAIAIRPNDARIQALLGWAYGELAKTNEAFAHNSKAIELDPKYTMAWINRGNAYMKLGQADKALADYSKAIEVDPKLAVAWNNRGNAYMKLGQADKALADYSKAIEVDPKLAMAWTNRGAAYEKRGEINKAIADYSKAIEVDPKLAMAWGNRGNNYNKLGQADKALADCSKAIELDPKLAAAWSNRGNAYRKLGQADKALADYSKAIELDPKLAAAWSNRGAAYAARGEINKAIADYSKAIEVDPKLAMAWNNRGAAYAARGEINKALADYSKAIEVDPKLAMAWNNRGNAYRKLGQADKALADYSKAIEVDLKLAMAWNNRGNAYMKLGQADKALADYSKAIEVDPKLAMAWNNRGNAYAVRGEINKAIADCSKAIEVDPKLAMAWCNRGNNYRKLGQADKALADCSKAIELDPKFVLAWNNRACAYLSLGQWAKAATDLTRVLELEPQNCAVRILLASCHVQLGRYQDALDGYNQLVERFPKDAQAHNDLAWLLATCPDAKFRDTGRAVELAKKAVELTPKQGEYWNTLGVAHYRAAAWKASVEALQKSMDLRKGGDAYDWFFLAMGHWRIGGKEQARNWYDQAVRWMEKNKPQDEELRRFRAEAAELLGIKK